MKATQYTTASSELELEHAFCRRRRSLHALSAAPWLSRAGRRTVLTHDGGGSTEPHA